MGQDESTLVGDDVAPQTLSARSLGAVAELISQGKVQNIVVLTGAGISTAAGIPDFRSPGTGLYSNLARLNLPRAEAVFDIGFFRTNPNPFYMLAQELYPGKHYPTVSHAFLALLVRKRLLRMLFTQNIDTLERAAGVPAELIVEAHGSFATQRCIECKTLFPDDEMREHVRRAAVPRCTCGGLVKPDIVFFGESLPERFFAQREVPAAADLMLILGTSLSVHPFASLPMVARPGVPRVLFNLEQVGGIGSRADDVLVLGDCDAGVRRLADALGWRHDLEALWRQTVGDVEVEMQLMRAEEARENGASEVSDGLEDKVQALVEGVERALKLDDGGGEGLANEEVGAREGRLGGPTTAVDSPSRLTEERLRSEQDFINATAGWQKGDSSEDGVPLKSGSSSSNSGQLPEIGIVPRTTARNDSLETSSASRNAPDCSSSTTDSAPHRNDPERSSSVPQNMDLLESSNTIDESNRDNNPSAQSPSTSTSTSNRASKDETTKPRSSSGRSRSSTGSETDRCQSGSLHSGDGQPSSHGGSTGGPPPPPRTHGVDKGGVDVKPAL